MIWLSELSLSRVTVFSFWVEERAFLCSAITRCIFLRLASSCLRDWASPVFGNREAISSNMKARMRKGYFSGRVCRL